jgi:CheY-like chemotaxis protein
MNLAINHGPAARSTLTRSRVPPPPLGVRFFEYACSAGPVRSNWQGFISGIHAASARVERAVGWLRGVRFRTGIAMDGSSGRSSARDLAARAAPLRILIVEDHDDSARVLGRLFELRGDTVFTAGTIAEARAVCARQTRLELIICDLALPDGDGCALSALAREYGAKAIAVTGCGMPADIERTRAAGFDAHLLKPVEFADLDATIERITAVPT